MPLLGHGVIERGPAGAPAAPPELRTPRPLSDPALAHWLELVEGEREFPLRWREGFRDAGTSGHASYLAPRIQASLLAPHNIDGRLLLELFDTDMRAELLHWCNGDGCD